MFLSAAYIMFLKETGRGLECVGDALLLKGMLVYIIHTFIFKT